MAKLIEYDVSGVEESQGGTGVKVRPGVVVARIALCEHRTQKSDGSPANDLRVGLDVGSDYDWVFTYIGLNEASDWKLAEFIRAIGLKDKGKLDPEKMKDKILRVRILPDNYEGEYSPKAGRLIPAQPGDEVGSGASEISSAGVGPEDEETQQGGGENAGEKTYANPEFVASREVDADGNPDAEVGSYDDWSDEDLLAEAEDRGLTLPGGRGSKRNKAIAALREEDAEVYGADGGAADGGDDGEFDIKSIEGYEDFDEWSNDDLKTELKERELSIGRFSEAKAREAIIAAVAEENGAGGDAGDGGGDDAAAQGDDYDEWDLDQLKKEWDEREMGDYPSVKGRNAEARVMTAMVEALREDDASNPFDA